VAEGLIDSVAECGYLLLQQIQEPLRAIGVIRIGKLLGDPLRQFHRLAAAFIGFLLIVALAIDFDQRRLPPGCVVQSLGSLGDCGCSTAYFS